MRRTRTACALVFAAAFAASAAAEEARVWLASSAAHEPVGEISILREDTPSGRPVPRVESLKNTVVNGRAGPDHVYPVLWRFQRKGLPVRVFEEFEDWRKVQEPYGDVVWIHRSQLSGEATVMARGGREQFHVLRRAPSDAAPAIAEIEGGALAELERCEGAWCRIEAGGLAGWAKADALWGADPFADPGPPEPVG